MRYNSPPAIRHSLLLLAIPLLALLIAGFSALFSLETPANASSLTEIAELLAHPEQYDHQDVVVAGKVTNVQLATNRQGQPAYGFLLQDQAGTLKVISLGQLEVREGDFVIVEGVFSRLRQVGRVIVYNEIKALSVKPLNRLDPDSIKKNRSLSATAAARQSSMGAGPRLFWRMAGASTSITASCPPSTPRTTAKRF
ncbi:MAG: hypothetical protein HP490_02970 [Nitrospira sp.]|nr:hypothetical protein [Nitrospira sp.]